MKYFWLIRHAKTAWPTAGQADIERELKKRGHSDGERMAGYFSAISNDSHKADWLVCSTAARAQQTADYVADGFAIEPDQTVFEPLLYHSDPATLLGAVQETPAQASCVAVVAHNPGMTWLVNQLAGARLQLENLPTFGCALFSAAVDDWADVHSAELVTFITPKLLAQQTDV